MKPLNSIELESCTLVEMLALYGVIEVERWVDRVGYRERATGFTHQERIRREIRQRNYPAHGRGQGR